MTAQTDTVITPKPDSLTRTAKHGFTPFEVYLAAVRDSEQADAESLFGDLADRTTDAEVLR